MTWLTAIRSSCFLCGPRCLSDDFFCLTDSPWLFILLVSLFFRIVRREGRDIGSR